MQISVSPDYSGILENTQFLAVVRKINNEEVEFEISNNGNQNLLAISRAGLGSLGAVYERTVQGTKKMESNFNVNFEMTSGFGFHGDIDGKFFGANLTWDYAFGELGHISVDMVNDVTHGLPDWASVGSQWNLNGDSVDINFKVATPKFERKLHINGGVKSASNFKLEVEHDIEIIPVPSFQISVKDENNDQEVIMIIGNEKLEIYLTENESRFNLDFEGLKQPITSIGGSYKARVAKLKS